MQSKSGFIHAIALAGVTVAGAAIAADLPKQGKYDVTACWSGVSNVVSFSKTHSAFSYEMTGTNRSNPPGGIFDKSTFRCVGMGGKLGGRALGSTVCESVDQDGDKRLAYFSVSSDGKTTRENVVGTGKYEGMVADGIVEPLGPFPTIKAGTFQNCNHQTGTYQLK